MNFEHSPKAIALQDLLQKFMNEEVYPVEKEYDEYMKTVANPWATPPLMQSLKAKAKAVGLWNLFLPIHEREDGLSNIDYAPLCEIMGRVLWAPEVFNCNAPDTGNMEVFIKYGSEAQKEKWLTPMLEGEIRSSFAMTEPDVASSDATNVQCSIVKDGDEYVINGRKWFITGIMHEACKIIIVMGKTDPDNPNRHVQQSQILVPKDTPGVEIIRPLTTLGYVGAPLGEAEMVFNNVRVPIGNLLLGEGRGFEIAQGRLGPGRIHHCMRLIGCAQRALELMCKRAETRSTFGFKLSENQSVREDIAQSFCDVEQARLLTMMAADKIDRDGAKEARDLIAAIKIVTPMMAARVIDRAIQIHGAGGLTDDYFLAEAYNYARQIRFADGPDQVHMMQLGRSLVKQYAQ
ncbi:MAG: acyl-CoA dehydrogenase family protein [Porticoccaceae bacterium]|nr:acyl-CoA dehydrogenase family protein [Porticoccaceae bacterium]